MTSSPTSSHSCSRRRCSCRGCSSPSIRCRRRCASSPRSCRSRTGSTSPDRYSRDAYPTTSCCISPCCLRTPALPTTRRWCSPGDVCFAKSVAMLWIKSLHIIFMVTWFAGLFYLPRLFVYHVLADDPPGRERFKLMERKLYVGIMTPGAVLTVVSGLWLWLGYGITGGWLYAKLALVASLIAHHVWLGKLMLDLRNERNRHGDTFYRWINEIPALPVLVGIVLLVVLKPF